MMKQKSDLESRLDSPHFFERNARRVKYAFDAVLEPAAVFGLSSYALINGLNIPLDKFLGGEPRSLFYSAAAGVTAPILIFLETKYNFVGKTMSRRFKYNKDKAKLRNKQGKRAIPPNPGLTGWIQTLGVGSLVYLLAMPQTNLPFTEIKNRHSLKYSGENLIANVREVWNSDNEVKRLSETSGFDYSAKGFDPNTVVHAQMMRMTSTQKAKEQMNLAHSRYQNYKNSVQNAYRDNNLSSLGISYKELVGLLAHESQFDPYAVSPMGAGGIGQQMPGFAINLGRKAFTYKDYQNNLSAYAHRLNQKKRNQLEELLKIDSRFNAEESIKMAAEGLASIRKSHISEDVGISISRYNTRGGAIEFAITHASSVLKKPRNKISYWEMAPYLKDEGRMYYANILATARIMDNPKLITSK